MCALAPGDGASILIEVAGAGMVDHGVVALTDHRPQAPVGESFATLRLIAIARAASVLPRPPAAASN